MVRSILAGFGAGAAFAAAMLVAVSLALPPPPERGPTPRIVAAAPPAEPTTVEPATVEPASEAASGPPRGRTPDPAPQRHAAADGGPDVAAQAPDRSATLPRAAPAAPGESAAVGAPAADPAPDVASAAPPSPTAAPSDGDRSPARPPAAASTGGPAASSAGRVASVAPGDAEARLPGAVGPERASGAGSVEADRQGPTLTEGAASAPGVPAPPSVTAAPSVPNAGAEKAARAMGTAGVVAATEGGEDSATDGRAVAAVAPEAEAVPPAGDRPTALPVVRRPEGDGAQRAAPGPSHRAERVARGDPGRPLDLAPDVVSGAEVARRLLSGPDLTSAARPMPRQPRARSVPQGEAPGVAASTAAGVASPGGATARRLAAGTEAAGAGAGAEFGVGLVRAAYVPPSGPAPRLTVTRIRAEAVPSAGERPRAHAKGDTGSPAQEVRRAGKAPAVAPGPADVPVARPAGEELPLPDGYEAMRPTADAPDTRLAQAPAPDDRRAAPGGGSASGAPNEDEARPDRPAPGAGSDTAPDAGRGASADAQRPAGGDGGGGDAVPVAEAEAEDSAGRPSVRILRPVPPSDGETAAPRLPGSGSIAPIIGSGESAPADTAEDTGASPAVAPEAGGALARNAMPFDAAEGRPLLGIVLRHVEGLSPSTVAALGLPLTVALDPDATDAAELAEAYRAAGLEVIIAGLGLPAGAEPQDVEVTVAARIAQFPGAIGVMDVVEGGFAGDTAQAAQVGRILAESGHGLLLWDEGLNSGLGAARAAGAVAGLVWRGVDRDGMSAPAIGRRIDRAVFEAARTGAVVVRAHGRSETLEALATFAAGAGQARAAPAPASAVLLRGE